MSNLIQDLRYGLRGLLRQPVFSLVAILSIALGIGANTAIFTLVDQVLLRLLPVKNPQELVLLTSVGEHRGNNRGGNALSYPMYVDFRDHNEVFSGTFCRYELPLNVEFGGRTERASGELVSGTYFQTLGVQTVIGRPITPDDDRTPGGHPVAVLSYDYWRNRFAADPGVIGQTIRVNNHAFTVIGVSQAGFDGLDIGRVPQIRVPIMMKAEMTPGWNDLDNRRSRWVNVFSRLKPGVTAVEAKAALQPFYHGLLEMEVTQEGFRGASPFERERFLKSIIDVLPGSQGRSYMRQQLTEPLWVLMGIVVGVLLIACANVANLLIARATARQKEMAVRLALGASRGRIIAQLLTESVLLAVVGGIAGLILAVPTSRLLLGFMPVDDVQTSTAISAMPDVRILGFNFALSLLTGVMFGLVPALRSTRPSLAPTLKDQAGAIAGGGQVRFRKALVVAQVSLSLLLLVGAGLFIRSLRNLRTLDLGLKPESLVAFSLDTTLNGYSVDRTKLFYKQMVERLRAIPGVRSAAFTAVGILEGNEWDSTVTVEGYEAKPGEDMNPYCNAASPGYFGTMGMRLLLGRDFDTRDERFNLPQTIDFGDTYRVAIANEKFAKKYFGDANPIGRHIGFGGDPGTKTPIEIVGIVKDAKYTGVRDEIPTQLFFPYLESIFAGDITVYVRTTDDPTAFFGTLRQTLQQLDANVPIYSMRTIERQLDRSLVNERLIASLSTSFGVLATLLALIGLYGVMAYMVARRTPEIGIRMALGAASGSVIWLVMREVVMLVGIGLAVGLAGAWVLSRFVQSQLYGITANDPMTAIFATLLLACAGAAAGFLPARRATRVNPVRALRYE